MSLAIFRDHKQQVQVMPYQGIAKHLHIEEVNLRLNFILNELVAGNQCNLGLFGCLPRVLQDRIVSPLDLNTAINLKITCIACRALVRENDHQKVRYTLRFFDVASYQIAKQIPSLSDSENVLLAIAQEVAERGDFKAALSNIDQLRDENSIRAKFGIKARITVLQALQRNLTPAIEFGLNQPLHFLDVAKALAEKGDYVDALKIANRLLSYGWKDVETIFEIIIHAQVARGDDVIALQTIAAIDYAKLPTLEKNLYIELAVAQARKGNIADAQATIAAMEDQEAMDSATTAVARVVAMETAHANHLQYPDLIEDELQRNEIYQEICSKYIKEGDFRNARLFMQFITTLSSKRDTYKQMIETHLSWIPASTGMLFKLDMQDEAYSLIGIDLVKGGDFAAAFKAFESIQDPVQRARAFQQAITAFYSTDLARSAKF